MAVALTGFEQSPYSPAHALFDVGTELNIPTWYNSALWLLLATAVAVVGSHARERRASWAGLAGVAAYASVDEFAMLHERLYGLGSWIAAALPHDPFSYRWVIAGTVIVVVVAVALAPLMSALPRHIMRGYVLAGFTFLLGAVGCETVGGFVEGHFGQVTWHLMLLIHIEEWLEMLGVALAIATTAAMVRWDRTRAGVSTSFVGYRH